LSATALTDWHLALTTDNDEDYRERRAEADRRNHRQVQTAGTDTDGRNRWTTKTADSDKDRRY
jgi:hypothetical protein